MSSWSSQGIRQEGEENAYDRTSDVYRDLVTLLKSKSPHFAENINKQVGFHVKQVAGFLRVIFALPITPRSSMHSN